MAYLSGHETTLSVKEESTFNGSPVGAFKLLEGITDLTLQRRSVKRYAKVDVWGNPTKDQHAISVYSGTVRCEWRHSSAFLRLVDTLLAPIDPQGDHMILTPSRDRRNRQSVKIWVRRKPGGEDWLFHGCILTRMQLVWKARDTVIVAMDFVAGRLEESPTPEGETDDGSSLHLKENLTLEADQTDYSDALFEITWNYSHPITFTGFDDSNIPTDFAEGPFEFGGAVAAHADDDSTLAGWLNAFTPFHLQLDSFAGTSASRFQILHRAQFQPNPASIADKKTPLVRRANFVGLINPLDAGGDEGDKELVVKHWPESA